MEAVENKPNIVVVLAGAVAKGAFGAGVLEVLAERGKVRILRLVGASSGALNAVAYGRAVRVDRELEGARQLVKMWQDDAELWNVFSPNARHIVRRHGLSDDRGLRRLLAEAVKVNDTGVERRIDVRIMVTPLKGENVTIGTASATSYEAMCHFDGSVYDHQHLLPSLFDAAAASATFPIAFAPVHVEGHGLCIDGGTTNNTPIKHAIDGIRSELDAVVVVTPTVEHVVERNDKVTGLGDLIGRMTDMLINERLYRDLREAEAFNQQLENLTKLGMSSTEYEAVIAALGWKGRRPIKMVRIRPLVPLEGGAFAGFSKRRLRLDYIAKGRERAEAVCDAEGW